jgi:DNA-binding LacI/PurR family transcriptional regulator/DNA-binding transcriptional regulator YhcF (GntR family)
MNNRIKRKPGIKKALEFLLAGINAGRWGTQLPSIRRLARNADVSFVTMWKAIGQLKTMRKTDLSPTGRAAITSPAAEEDLFTFDKGMQGFDTVPEYPGVLWLKLKAQIQKDIFTGKFAPGEKMPFIKELQYRYDVSFTTLKKALESLEADNTIRARGKGYAIPTLTSADHHDRIVAIGCGREDAKIWSDHQDKQCFFLFESECIQKKIGLDIAVYFHQNGRLRYIHSATRQPYNLKGDTVLGIAYIVANLEVDPAEVLKELIANDKPIAVLDIVGGWKMPDSLKHHPGIKFFTTTASTHPAKHIAKYLLNLGHTRIGFFSPFHRAAWSQYRLEGVNEIYRNAGFPAAVTSYVLNSYAYQWEFIHHLENKEDIRSFFEQNEKGKNFRSKFSRKFGNIGYSISKYLTEQNCATGEIYEKMSPLLTKALRERDITAWIFANDFAATLALDFLDAAGVSVPRDLSVIGFDNSLDAMEYQLTSYDFNTVGIINAMIRYIISPTVFPLQNPLEAEGAIIKRRSTARIRDPMKYSGSSIQTPVAGNKEVA